MTTTMMNARTNRIAFVSLMMPILLGLVLVLGPGCSSKVTAASPPPPAVPQVLHRQNHSHWVNYYNNLHYPSNTTTAGSVMRNNVSTFFQQQQQQQLLQRHLQQGPGQVSPLWMDYEDYENNYTHFTDEMKGYLDNESLLLERGSPDFFVYSMIPEPPQRLWPIIKGIVVRNHLENKILWVRPAYLIANGLDLGCRQLKPGAAATGSASDGGDDNGGLVGANDHIPVDSALCEEHCTHRGRYCAPVLPANLPAQISGNELVKEALRRLCMDSYYHASDFKFFLYLETFERANCLYSSNMTNCSLAVIDGISHLDYANFVDCVGTPEELVSDVVNLKLEDQLRHLVQYKYGVEQMPALFIGGVKYDGPMETANILETYCQSFHRDDNLHPLSCDICEADCIDIRKCLWTLDCNGVQFDPHAFMVEEEAEAAAAAQQEQDAAAAGAFGGDTTEAPVVTTEAPLASELEKWEEEQTETEANDKTILIFFIVAIAFSGITALLFVFRDRRLQAFRRGLAQQHTEHLSPAHHDPAWFGNAYHDSVGNDLNYNMDDSYTDHVEMPAARQRSGGARPSRPTPATGAHLPPKGAFLPDVA